MLLKTSALCVAVFLARSVLASATEYAQCGGAGWTGSTSCSVGYLCKETAESYSQCVPEVAAAEIPSNIPRASLYQITSNFGKNPTNVKFYIYVPTKVVEKPPIVVAMHYCTGTANAYYTGTPVKGQADSKGFVVIYPQAPDSGGCWDVHSDATFKHDAGGDSLGIVSAVRWTITNLGADATRVYAMGTSSGAMMTQVLMGAYPDVFAAGSSWSGVPYACFAGAGMWNSACANGQTSKTPQAWGDLVRNGYPGFNGTRPKVQLWHGSADTTLNYNNFGEGIKQWTNVAGLNQTATTKQTNYASQNGWTMSLYGTDVMGISASGGSHNLPMQIGQVMSWFGL